MSQFNDFIIGDYIDTNENLKLKTFSGYKYINEYCSSIGDHEKNLHKIDHGLINNCILLKVTFSISPILQRASNGY